MRGNRITKSTRLVAGLISGLLFAIAALPLAAQPARQLHPFYDSSKEVTLNGTVSSLIDKASPGTMIGPHLLFTTASGEVDASLGKFASQGKGALSVVPGQAVEVTGVMKTIGAKDVFVARVVKVGGRVYTLRNQHGFALSPLSHERASQKAAQKGESL
jgi:hypothetical protein